MRLLFYCKLRFPKSQSKESATNFTIETADFFSRFVSATILSTDFLNALSFSPLLLSVESKIVWAKSQENACFNFVAISFFFPLFNPCAKKVFIARFFRATKQNDFRANFGEFGFLYSFIKQFHDDFPHSHTMIIS